jgi:hypothetical protein
MTKTVCINLATTIQHAFDAVRVLKNAPSAIRRLRISSAFIVRDEPIQYDTKSSLIELIHSQHMSISSKKPSGKFLFHFSTSFFLSLLLNAFLRSIVSISNRFRTLDVPITT